jgi:3-oxoadipate enol-lactonase
MSEKSSKTDERCAAVVQELRLGTNLNVHYLDLNPDGRHPVLLLHGLGASGESWELQFPPLASANFRILAPDARGFGKSSYPGGGLSIKDMAADTAKLLQHVNSAAPHVVGISMGGTVALQLAMDHPQWVNKLVLVNTFARLRPRHPGVWIYFALRFLVVHTLGLATQARIVTRRIFPQPEQAFFRNALYQQVIQADPRAYRAALRALGRFNVVNRLADIKAPTLIVSGRDDTTVPLNNQSFLAVKIPHAEHKIIANAGHAITAERPEEFNQVMINFLAS